RYAGHPWVRGRGEDHVVGVLRREEHVASVVLVEAETRVVQGLIVDVLEESGRLDHRRLELDRRHAPDGPAERRAGAHPASPADDEYILRPGGKEQWRRGHHPR